jgi:HAD superfamily hydrolase (TIGR01509 family)
VLDRLRIPACVASSSAHERIRRSLRVAGFIDRFEGRIFSAEDVARGKPAPDLFLHAAQSMGVPPERCIVTEDSPSGVEAARAADMTVYGYCAMTPESRLCEADAVFRNMAELPWLLGPHVCPAVA